MTNPFLKRLIHILVPMPSLTKTSGTADFLEGITTMGTSVLSVLVCVILIFGVVTRTLAWTVEHGWPTLATGTLAVLAAIYIVAQEFRFIRWQTRHWAIYFAALKARWSNEAENAKV